jgi:NAD(P)H-dependent flavin oxidoreductase YrpB (nitropropane dioxygenase family)
MRDDSLPQIIQGGMGIGLSNWRLARAVSRLGHLGVVSGTALDAVAARRLQQGDPGGHMMRALEHFPKLDAVMPLALRHYKPDAAGAKERFKITPMATIESSQDHTNLLVAANFAEVFLAKEGHPGLVGINLLEKIQIPTLAALYGAMLAEVDYVLMGAGIPNRIPGVLDQLAAGEPVSLKIDVAGAPEGRSYTISFDPRQFWKGKPPLLKRPHFLPIVSSATLAMNLAKKANGKISGFVIEGSSAGGHNAPPRGQVQLNARGEPIYGPKDVPDLDRFRQLGYPFWLAGSYGAPGKLEEAMQLGATGIQVGTPFAYCEESGMDPELRLQVLRLVKEGKVDVYTDPLASPTGFPFKVVAVEGSVSSDAVNQARRRVCDIGLLRQAYQRPDGTVGYRCASEPVDDYVRKGGELEDTEGRKCVCNGLLSTIGLGQVNRDGTVEPPLITAGDSLAGLNVFLGPDSLVYTAADVVRILTAKAPNPLAVLQV